MAFDHTAETRENESGRRAKNATGVIVWLQNMAHRSQTARTAIVTDKKKCVIPQKSMLARVQCLVDHANGLEAFESATTGAWQALTDEPPLAWQA
jgi:hypothetical protein